MKNHFAQVEKTRRKEDTTATPPHIVIIDDQIANLKIQFLDKALKRFTPPNATITKIGTTEAFDAFLKNLAPYNTSNTVIICDYDLSAWGENRTMEDHIIEITEQTPKATHIAYTSSDNNILGKNYTQRCTHCTLGNIQQSLQRDASPTRS